MSSRKLMTPKLSIFLRTKFHSTKNPSKLQSFLSKSQSLTTHLPNFEPLHKTLQSRDFFRNLKLSRIAFSSDSARNVESFKCWNCNAVSGTTPFLFCQSCRSVQPVDKSVDYFQLFGLDRNYDIGNADLEGKYKNWQKKLHPDLVHTKSEKEREFAAEQSARVTDAYRTLNKSLLRAIYILKLDGVEVDQEETIYEPELLAEIMELREAVEDAADSKALKQIQSQIQEKLVHWSTAFANAFQQKQYDDAVNCIRRMTYYHRAGEEIVKRL